MTGNPRNENLPVSHQLPLEHPLPVETGTATCKRDGKGSPFAVVVNLMLKALGTRLLYSLEPSGTGLDIS